MATTGRRWNPSRSGSPVRPGPRPDGPPSAMATTDTTGTEFSTDLAGAAPEEHVPPGIGPYQLAWRRLKRNKVALAFGALFLIIVILCLLAPVYAKQIAHTGPAANHL